MASNVTPVWSDLTTIIASQTLALNAVVRATIDLTTKIGMILFIRIGRQGTTALSAGVRVDVNRYVKADGTVTHPGPIGTLLGQTAAAASTTVNADTAAAQNRLNVASTTSFAAGDYILIGGGTARQEWARVSNVVDATHLDLASNLLNAHTAAQADTVRNKADLFPPFWIPGGAIIQVIVDYGGNTTGDSVTVEALGQTYNSDQIV